MQHDGIGCGSRHEPVIDAVAGEGFLPRFGFGFLAHRRPDIGVHHVRAGDGFFGIFRHGQLRARGVRLEEMAVGFVAFGTREPQLETEESRGLDP
jgi:hypothetical protein